MNMCTRLACVLMVLIASSAALGSASPTPATTVPRSSGSNGFAILNDADPTTGPTPTGSSTPPTVGPPPTSPPATTSPPTTPPATTSPAPTHSAQPPTSEPPTSAPPTHQPTSNTPGTSKPPETQRPSEAPKPTETSKGTDSPNNNNKNNNNSNNSNNGTSSNATNNSNNGTSLINNSNTTSTRNTTTTSSNTQPTTHTSHATSTAETASSMDHENASPSPTKITATNTSSSSSKMSSGVIAAIVIGAAAALMVVVLFTKHLIQKTRTSDYDEDPFSPLNLGRNDDNFARRDNATTMMRAVPVRGGTLMNSQLSSFNQFQPNKQSMQQPYVMRGMISPQSKSIEISRFTNVGSLENPISCSVAYVTSPTSQASSLMDEAPEMSAPSSEKMPMQQDMVLDGEIEQENLWTNAMNGDQQQQTNVNDTAGSSEDVASAAQEYPASVRSPGGFGSFLSDDASSSYGRPSDEEGQPSESSVFSNGRDSYDPIHSSEYGDNSTFLSNDGDSIGRTTESYASSNPSRKSSTVSEGINSLHDSNFDVTALHEGTSCTDLSLSCSIEL